MYFKIIILPLIRSLIVYYKVYQIGIIHFIFNKNVFKRTVKIIFSSKLCGRLVGTGF